MPTEAALLAAALQARRLELMEGKPGWRSDSCGGALAGEGKTGAGLGGASWQGKRGASGGDVGPGRSQSRRVASQRRCGATGGRKNCGEDLAAALSSFHAGGR